ncbi:hypothetical protein [Aestuariirhabdus litorea]|uniref:Uncharacterized protein n=1 Tax=Aestuariirhabdus litorea TaxID=2528527 RepID=A0A3P3VMQ2_9GAMM|nr:hypothetical protein [Aestuariirhabdus litorea]RRJ83890.1 hypothetical protein D0544_01865 [Aestuariirhabdus litorea]RWW97112.1 hypothetical protein DZC74_01865 [Endozoicomonadaceae bacterium GTF-13]
MTRSPFQPGFLGLFFALAPVLAATLLLYWGGLSGTVVLDDRHIIDGLRAIDTGTSLQDYLLKGVGELNRPIAYLTFYWQRDLVEPTLWSFKVVNLFLHLANVVLVFALLYQLIRHTRYKPQKLWLATGATAIWALSPLQVSTVLYMVQRMTELSALFVLAALLCWYQGRFPSKAQYRRLAWLYLGFGICMLLALLSKESAITGCVMVLVLDATLLGKESKDRTYRIWRWLAIYLPLMLVALYFFIKWKSIATYGGREFTLEERLLTQPRILFDYIAKFVAPRWGGYGLFYNEYPFSRSLTDPLTTLIAVTAIAVGAGVAIWKRTAWPIASFAVLFFLAGHLVESTFIPLELYFEHRNYLPTVAIALLLATAVGQIVQRVHRKPLLVLVCLSTAIWLVAMVAVSRNEVRMWGAPLPQALHWYQQHPDSHRAHSHLGELMFNLGMHQQSARFYEQTIERFPNDPSKMLLWWELGCFPSVELRPELERVKQVLRSGDHYRETISVLKAMLELVESGKCQSLSLDDLLAAADTLLSNPSYKKHVKSILVLMSRLYELKGDGRKGLEYLEIAASKYQTLDILLALSQRYYLTGQINKGDRTYALIESKCSSISRACWQQEQSIVQLRALKERVKRGRDANN